MNLEIPEGIEVIKEGKLLVVKGLKGELKSVLEFPKIELIIETGKIVLKVKRLTQREKKSLGTMQSLIKNMIEGVTGGFVYKLKICSGHFPMSVSIKGNEFVVTNFIGEKHPRRLQITEGVKVDVAGDIVEVTGIDKQLVSQVAASIESLLKRADYDKRIFQDGIYITEKHGKEIK